MSEPVKFDHRFLFIWHTTWAEPCPKCRRLNGKSWQGQDLYQHVLWDDFEGPIWDLDNDLPLTHTNCKCVLEVQYESTLEELLGFEKSGFEDWQIMTSNIKEMKQELSEFDSQLYKTKTAANETQVELAALYLLMRRAHFPPEIEKAITIMTRFKVAAIYGGKALETFTAASIGAFAGPGGWILGAAYMGISLLAVSDTMVDLGGT